MQRTLLLFLLCLPLGLFAFTVEATPTGPIVPQDTTHRPAFLPAAIRNIPPADTLSIEKDFDTDAFASEETTEILLANTGLGLEFILSPEVLEPFKNAAITAENSALGFDAFLLATANDFESKHILYRSIPLSDCSGMFHRLLSKMKEVFPEYQYPEVSDARSSRALAQWYYDHGALHVIEDAANSGQLIRPGSIMFFGQVGKKYAHPTIEQLVISGVGIQHIGTVVDVQKDEEGNVIGYTLFHARGRGKIASKTQHYLQHPRYSYLPAFGNWKQQLLAIGNIATEPVERIAAE